MSGWHARCWRHRNSSARNSPGTLQNPRLPTCQAMSPRSGGTVSSSRSLCGMALNSVSIEPCLKLRVQKLPFFRPSIWRVRRFRRSRTSHFDAMYDCRQSLPAQSRCKSPAAQCEPRYRQCEVIGDEGRCPHPQAYRSQSGSWSLI